MPFNDAVPVRTRNALISQRGIALVLVLWIIALLTVMALGVTTTQRTESALIANQVAQAQFRAAADAALNLAVLNLGSVPLEAVPAEALWLPDGTPYRLTIGGQPYLVTLSNESSRLDLNSISREQLVILIEIAQGAGGFDAARRDALADAILDWRDSDDMMLLNGAEDSQYESAGYPYGARDEPFQSVEELRQVFGMTADIYKRLAADLTVAGDTRSAGGAPSETSSLGGRSRRGSASSGSLNLTFASAAVLAVTQGISLQDAEQAVAERFEPVVAGAEQSPVVDRGGPLYRVRVTGANAEGVNTGPAIEILVELGPGRQPPFEVLWRREGLIGTDTSEAQALVGEKE